MLEEATRLEAVSDMVKLVIVYGICQFIGNFSCPLDEVVNQSKRGHLSSTAKSALEILKISLYEIELWTGNSVEYKPHVEFQSQFEEVW